MSRYLGFFLILFVTLPVGAQKIKGPFISIFPFANLADDRGTDWIGFGIGYNVTEGLKSVNGVRSVDYAKALSTRASFPFDAKKATDENIITGNLVDANQTLQTSHTLIGSYKQTKEGKLVLKCRLLDNKTKATKALFDTLDNKSMADLSGICSFIVLWAVEAAGGTISDTDRNAVLISTAVDEEFDKFIGLWSADQSYLNGLNLMDEGRFDEAILELKTAVRLNEGISAYTHDLAAALIARGTDRFKANKLESASDDYQAASKIDPKNFRIFYNLGNVERSKGNMADAAHHYQKAISLDSTFFKAYANLGMVLQQQGHSLKALDAYKKAVALNKESADAFYNLGLIHDSMDSSAQAIKHYERAVQLDKKNADAHLNLGILYKMTKQPKKAEVEYLSAITYKAINPVAHRNLGILYSSDRANWDRAIKHLEYSVAQDPNQDDVEVIKSNIEIMKKAVKK